MVGSQIYLLHRQLPEAGAKSPHIPPVCPAMLLYHIAGATLSCVTAGTSHRSPRGNQSQNVLDAPVTGLLVAFPRAGFPLREEAPLGIKLVGHGKSQARPAVYSLVEPVPPSVQSACSRATLRKTPLALPTVCMVFLSKYIQEIMYVSGPGP